MEAAAARKEWRAGPDSPLHSNGTEDAAEHGKMEQSEERAIYEGGAGGSEMDFCSITIDGSGGLSEDILRQRLQSVVRQREELQRVEIELRAQVIAHPQILEAQRSFEAAKEHAAAAAKLKEQLQEREKYIIELEMNLDDKNRQLDALKIDHQTVWANQDLLIEQTKELATFRRERDNSEAERAQHLKQIHDLQEHLREKESQSVALEEQHRVAQENIIYKDEQLREAHTWVARVQEMDALQSQSLQAELRERTEQFNQFWMGFQQQYAEMQRSLLHTVQQLQLELTEAREQTGAQKDSSQATQESLAESSFVQSKGSNTTANGNTAADGNQTLKSNGSSDGSTKGKHASAVPVVPSSLLGIGGFLPSGQMTGMHPYMIHPQGIPQPLTSANSGVPQFGNFQSQPTILSNQQWPNQQGASDASQTPDKTNYRPSQSDQSALQSDANYKDELSAQQTQVTHPEHLIAHGKQQQSSMNAISELTHEPKVVESNVTEYLVHKEQQKISKEQDAASNVNISTGSFEHQEQKTEPKDGKVAAVKQSEEQVPGGHKTSTFVASTGQSHFKKNAAELNSNVVNQAGTLRSVGSGSGSLLRDRPKEPALLDERSLLACIVRAVPAGADGQIRISTTLPNRLGKMLAPLHWHDYKKHYGRLDDFVANHPELFVIEGDFIHLREGAQQIISATTAAAKIAAATASSAPYSSLLPSVAVTPVAQSIRQKRVSIVDSRSSKTMPSGNGSTATSFGDHFDKRLQIPEANDQQQTVGFNIVQRVGDVTISNKLQNLQENGFSAEIQPGQSSLHPVPANGGRHERGLPTHDKGVSNIRHGHGGKQHGRSTGTAYISRR